MFRRGLTLLIFLMVIEPVWASEQPFNMGLKLFQPITVTKKKDITFPTKILTATNEVIVVSTSDIGAASFDASGGIGRSLVRSVLESNIVLSAPGNDTTIIVDTIVVAGPTSFDAEGRALDLKIGANANILADSKDGDYIGVGTFRVVYQ